MILAFDTETTGLPNFREPSDHPSQPHIVQLALVSCADDGTEAEVISVIVRPDGWVISPEVAAIHGITHERAMDEGVPERHAVGLFVVAQGRASVRVAHNEAFDRRIMRIAMIRSGFKRDFIEMIEGRSAFCTCNAASPLVNLPPTDRMIAAGINRPKSAGLADCIKHFFGEELVGAHDALIDARAAARLYFQLREDVQ